MGRDDMSQGTLLARPEFWSERDQRSTTNAHKKPDAAHTDHGLSVTQRLRIMLRSDVGAAGLEVEGPRLVRIVHEQMRY